MSNPQTVEIRPLEDPAELHQAVALYRRVFDLSPTDPAIGPRLLAALRHNGGTVVGAFRATDPDELVGFVYGFIGMDPDTREIYHYSQTAAVAPEMQGAGVGRALKLGQRDQVLTTGIARMRWSFDPLRAANGRFNLNTLGARGRWFVPNLYGIERMGPDRGLPSDRMIVDWDLAASAESGHTSTDQSCEPTPDILPEPGAVVRTADRLFVGVPAQPTHDPGTRNAVSTALQEALADDWVVVSCQRGHATGSGAYYVLAPETDSRLASGSGGHPGTEPITQHISNEFRETS